MNYIELIKNRGHVSKFKTKDLTSEDQEIINNIILEASNKYADQIKLEGLDGDFVYKNLLDYEDKYGKIVEAPMYISITTTDVKKGYEKTGFIGEWMISRFIEKGIDARWLKITDHDPEVFQAFNFEEGSYLVNFIAVGYGVKETNIAKLIKHKYKNSIKSLTGMGYSDSMDIKNDSDIVYKLNIHEFVFDGKFESYFNDNELFNTGLQRVFQELHFAPDITSQQFWRVLVHEGKIFIVFVSDDKIAKVEAGIVRFYLGEALKNNGIRSQWYEIDDAMDLSQYKFPENTFVPGYFTY